MEISQNCKAISDLYKQQVTAMRFSVQKCFVGYLIEEHLQSIEQHYIMGLRFIM